MQIQDKADLRGQDEFLGSPDGGKFRVSFVEPEQNCGSCHAMQAARAHLDDAWKVEGGHDPDRAAIDFIARGQQRGRRKSARLIALDAAENGGGRRSVSPGGTRRGKSVLGKPAARAAERGNNAAWGKDCRSKAAGPIRNRDDFSANMRMVIPKNDNF